MTFMQGNNSQLLDKCIISSWKCSPMSYLNSWNQLLIFKLITSSDLNSFVAFLNSENFPLTMFVNMLIIVHASTCEIPWFTVILFSCLLFCTWVCFKVNQLFHSETSQDLILEKVCFRNSSKQKVWVPSSYIFAVPRALCHSNRELSYHLWGREQVVGFSNKDSTHRFYKDHALSEELWTYPLPIT